MRFHHLVRACCAALVLGSATAAQAAGDAAFPDRPIQLVIPFQPGDTDQMLRPIADRMGRYLGQPLVLNYRSGAGGGIGASYVAGASPDGYTLVGSSPGSLVIVPLANKGMKYTTASFKPVAALSEGGLMLLVSSNSPYKTLDDVVRDAKARPGEITYGSSGAMGITHLLAEIFAQKAGIKLEHVPFQGSTPAITALIGGHTAMASAAIAPARAHIQSGSLRPLAVFGTRRLAAFPDVPTVKELGYDVGSPTLYGIMAPKDTPDQAIDALYQAARKAIDEHREQIAASLATLGAEISLLGPRDYGAYLADQQALFSAGLRALNP